MKNPMPVELDPRSSGLSDISLTLAGFEGITLNELKNADAQLLSRKEKKFLMTREQCLWLISGLIKSYYALEIEGTRIGCDRTEYYDTDSFQIYLPHHNGKANRHKLRSRYYFTTDETYLEVKERQNTGRTVKKRIQTDGSPSLPDPDAGAFLESVFPYDFRLFHPVLATFYNRVTLVSKDFRERITFDLNLAFHNGKNACSYQDIVVGEIKYDRSLLRSMAFTALRMMRIYKTGFSKYCIGVSLLYQEQKHNRFKPL